MSPGRAIWAVNGVDRFNGPTCSDAHETYLTTRAVLWPENRAKQCKFDVNTVGNFIQKLLRSTEKPRSFHLTTPHQWTLTNIIIRLRPNRQKPQTMGYIVVADSICAYPSPSILKQSWPKHQINHAKRFYSENSIQRKTAIQCHSRSSVICFDVDEKPMGDSE